MLGCCGARSVFCGDGSLFFVHTTLVQASYLNYVLVCICIVDRGQLRTMHIYICIVISSL